MMMQQRQVPSVAIREWSSNRHRMDRVVYDSFAFGLVWADELVVIPTSPKVAASVIENHRDRENGVSPCVSCRWFRPHCQSSINRPGTRLNSEVLFVTRTRPRDRAIDAIIRSFGPIGVPSVAKCARIEPHRSAAKSSNGLDKKISRS